MVEIAYGYDCYGLRVAKKMIADERKVMASDPLTRRSKNPYTRGYRDALTTLDNRIAARIKEIQEGLSR